MPIRRYRYKDFFSQHEELIFKNLPPKNIECIYCGSKNISDYSNNNHYEIYYCNDCDEYFYAD